MMDWVQSLPIVPAVAFLYVVVLCRAGATYALGRGARKAANRGKVCLLYTSPSPRDRTRSRMPSSA